jgi:hypothetical protein
MKSQFRSVCPECQQVIKVSAEIEKVGSDWVHVTCVSAHQATVANRRVARDAELASLIDEMNLLDDQIRHHRQPELLAEMFRTEAGRKAARAMVAEHREWAALKTR